MKKLKLSAILTSVFGLFLVMSCSNDDDIVNIDPGNDDGGELVANFEGVFVQEDQAGRPGINTVFSANGDIEDAFNVTIPSEMTAIFQQGFENQLAGLHAAFGVEYENNILGLDITTLTTILATDVLQVAPDAPTSYFDGTNVLTGRGLADDVIDISLILLFGGNNGARFDGNNGTPLLVSDGVPTNDQNFQNTFPYLSTPF